MDYEKILKEAHEAARLAQIGGHDRGACGFAWVTIDGNDGLARHCRKMAKQAEDRGVPYAQGRGLYGSKGYPKGWQFWKPGGFGGQAIETHEQGSVAFRDKLGEYGIRADCGSRLD